MACPFSLAVNFCRVGFVKFLCLGGGNRGADGAKLLIAEAVNDKEIDHKLYDGNVTVCGPGFRKDQSFFRVRVQTKVPVANSDRPMEKRMVKM